MTGSAAPRTIRVLLALVPPGATTQYVDQVVKELPEEISVSYFTWRRALLSRYDVLHLHWPEQLARGGSSLMTFVKRLALLLVLCRMWVLRTALVRTAHNINPHEEGSRLERWLLRTLDASTTLTIVLNDSTPIEPGKRTRLIPHGHYRDAFEPHPRWDPIRGRITFFGLIREYKGVERLIEVFRSLPDDGLTLRIVGSPAGPFWRELVEDAGAADPRISARLEFVDDEVLVEEVSKSELVVLPYRAMHNSGAIFAALSLDRPVLAPSSPVNVDLQSEVGAGWICLYEGDLDESVLVDAVAAVRAEGRTLRPSMVGRDWAAVGRLHAEAYRAALDARRTRRFPSRHNAVRRKRP